VTMLHECAARGMGLSHRWNLDVGTIEYKPNTYKFTVLGRRNDQCEYCEMYRVYLFSASGEYLPRYDNKTRVTYNDGERPDAMMIQRMLEERRREDRRSRRKERQQPRSRRLKVA